MIRKIDRGDKRRQYFVDPTIGVKRADVTNGLISLIEQNRVSPSVSSLKKVLGRIPMSLS